MLASHRLVYSVQSAYKFAQAHHHQNLDVMNPFRHSMNVSLLSSCHCDTQLLLCAPPGQTALQQPCLPATAGAEGCRVETQSSRWRGTDIYKGERGGGGWRGVGGRGGGCWSWSQFFCGALPSDHLHQVDIRRVYSGVCNCILSPVLHCQPWKWNLINPDQFLMYKMNWQGFKKKKKKKRGWCGGVGDYNSNQVNDTWQFFSENDWAAHQPPQPYCNLPPPYQPPQTPLPAHTTFNYHITPDLFFLSKAWQACSWGGGLKVKVHVCTDLCVRIHVCLNASIYEDTLHSSVGPAFVHVFCVCREGGLQGEWGSPVEVQLWKWEGNDFTDGTSWNSDFSWPLAVCLFSRVYKEDWNNNLSLVHYILV